MNSRMKTFLELAHHAGEEQLPIACHFWLCLALGEANKLHDVHAVSNIMRALSAIRQHKGYRAI